MKKIVKIVTEGAWAIVNCKDTYTGRSRFSCSSVSPLVPIQENTTKNSLIARVRYYKGVIARNTREKSWNVIYKFSLRSLDPFLNRGLSSYFEGRATKRMFDTIMKFVRVSAIICTIQAHNTFGTLAQCSITHVDLHFYRTASWPKDSTKEKSPSTHSSTRDLDSLTILNRQSSRNNFIYSSIARSIFFRRSNISDIGTSIVTNIFLFFI